MRYISFLEDESQMTPKAVILIKNDAFRQKSLEGFYLNPLKHQNVKANDVFAMSLQYNELNKAPVSLINTYLEELLPALDKMGCRILYVADSNYFKRLTKTKSLNDSYGYALPCTLKGYEHFTCVYGTNYQALMYNEQLKEKLDISITVLAELINTGEIETVLGSDIIKFAEYPKTVQDIAKWLIKLYSKKELAVDIETFSLRFEKAGIGTIGFAWSKHEGIAFPVDLHFSEEEAKEVKTMLRHFFTQYRGKLKLFNCLFDNTILIYELFMNDDVDFKGMRYGIEKFKDVDDVMFKAFLSLNSTLDVKQDLKTLAYPFTGSYAEDVKDIRLVPLDDLLTYNLKDCLGTLYVDEVYHPRMVADDQLGYYQNMLMPSTLFAYEMKLVGLPMNLDKVEEVFRYVRSVANGARRRLNQIPYIVTSNHMAMVKRWEDANAKRKKLIRPLHEYDEPMNTNSDPQVARLLYEVMELPVLVTTPTGNPSASSKVIQRLLGMTSDQTKRDVLERLIELSDTKTILNTFIPAFKNYAFTRKGGVSEGYQDLANTTWLNGSIKLTGTQGGRMSGSEPNLTNLPSGSVYGSAVKSAFIAPKGWLIGAADFASLEDRVSAIRTQDPMKIKVYTDGYDGHCLRAYSYFGNQMPTINDLSVTTINSIKKIHPDLRDKSKSPTFALTYNGTHVTLINNLGFSREEAMAIEANFHELYKVSKIYSDMVIARASNLGYITLAFGLRMRTPLLHACKGKKFTYPAIEEGRSAYNADSQSWGLLTNRAVIELRDRLMKAPEHIRDSILIINAIHDASYYLLRDDIQVIEWLNINLIECMNWNDDPGVFHAEVGMEAELDIGHTWEKMVTIPNRAEISTIEELRATLDD